MTLTEAVLDKIAALESDEELSLLSRFDHCTAWLLGSIVRERAVADSAAVVVDIRRPWGQILFCSALSGATKNHDDWVRRKVATVVRFEASSALVGARLQADGIDLESVGWLPPTDFALAGGGFPIRVRGAGLVAVVTVSGLSADEDRDYIVESLRALPASATEISSNRR